MKQLNFKPLQVKLFCKYAPLTDQECFSLMAQKRKLDEHFMHLAILFFYSNVVFFVIESINVKSVNQLINQLMSKSSDSAE